MISQSQLYILLAIGLKYFGGYKYEIIISTIISSNEISSLLFDLELSSNKRSSIAD